ARRPAARRPAVRRELALPHRPRAGAGDRLRHRSGAPPMRQFGDTAAEFVPAAERVFGKRARVLDGSRALLVDDIKLSLENGERELCLIRVRNLELENRACTCDG